MNAPRASLQHVTALGKEIWHSDGNPGPLPKAWVLAVRGYRATTMGDPDRNDVGIYDDAFFLVTPTCFFPVNANTDPSKLGWNPGVGKPYGMLKTGHVWWFYPGPHKGRLPAFRQADNAMVADRLGIPHNGQFLVTRMWGWDDPRNKEEWGHQQVNIHLGGSVGTSSWLCLTVPPETGDPWLQRTTDELKQHRQRTLPVVLIDGPIC